MAFGWFEAWHSRLITWLVLAGLAFAFVIYYFGFLRITRTNIRRLQGVIGKACLFGFFSWKSYIVMAVMMTMGILLRHSAIPRQYLAVLYESIGGSMIFSSLHYYPPAVSRISQLFFT